MEKQNRAHVDELLVNAEKEIRELERDITRKHRKRDCWSQKQGI